METTPTRGELVVLGVILVVLGLISGPNPAMILVGGLAAAVGILEGRAAWTAR